jgi:hypothetical protein
MRFIVIDSESDGLAYEATKLHILAWTEDGETIHHTHDYDEMIQLLSQDDCMFVAHNAIRHDLPLFNRLLGVNLKYHQFVDSLFLSWYLNFDRDRHGLGDYGVEYGVPKPKVEDWHNASLEVYRTRVVEDVKINWKLWCDLLRKLTILYPEESERVRLINYLSFKGDCAREQEENPITLDMEAVNAHYNTLDTLQREKVEQLSAVMPKKPIIKSVTRPKNLYKKDGTLSSHGERWFELLQEQKLPSATVGPVNVVTGYQEGNPNSADQVKQWLYGLGWKPATFKFVKDDDGSERSIPQIKNGDDLCQSVLDLAEDVPEVQLLVDMGIIQHRKSIFKSFLDNNKDGKVVASVGGLTNTFRFKHRKPIVNLPKVSVPWGKEVRGCIAAPEGYTLCGSDMVSLEDTTKRHYMKPFDPDYVKLMSEPGFDPHLDLAAFAGAVTRDQVEEHKNGEINLKAIRQQYKAANYSCVYGVGKAKLGRTLGIPVKAAEKLIEAYWQRNFSVKKAVEKFDIKVVGPYMWVKNPVSGFWHNLRSEKDAFSTVNQSTGVYCFDTWLAHVRRSGVKITLQMHDEIGLYLPQGEEGAYRDILKDAIAKTNEKVKLNVVLDIDVQFGERYSDTH